MDIPKWFWKILFYTSCVGSGYVLFLMATGEKDRGYIWYLFLFLMALWFAMRQMRKS
ncbi:hypothetical protein SAMN05192588_2848 [Nonlabens sp. Hel1_33_55]|uniref:hypothetical protein n=1 Tax=Nonlabens sp. Hel1_33_55 TaxID=1336802 RepID=UPI000875B1B4|nr:hypothetical protein [Nonlabens sp. Hel1_33_55]SCY43075.1 hypothetical protein SAMN05192588_2848 [Nonlabens sp. Hel1_33_55]